MDAPSGQTASRNEVEANSKFKIRIGPVRARLTAAVHPRRRNKPVAFSRFHQKNEAINRRDLMNAEKRNDDFFRIS
jgi:hypothetical protein